MHTETSVKKRALERFVELGVSKEVNELIEKSSGMPSPSTCDYERFIEPEFKDSYVVLVNGKLVAVKGCPALSLDEAMKTYSTLLVNSMSKVVKESTNPLELLNIAMAKDGVCIMLLPKTKTKVQLISIIDTETCTIMPRIHIFAANSSELTLVQSKEAVKAQGCFYNQLIHVQCEDNARVILEEVQDEFEHYEHVRAQLKRSSIFNTVFVASNAKRNIQIALCGENAEAESSGIWLLNKDQTIDTVVCMDHQEPHCRSMQLFKGVLQDRATSTFEGKIYVRQKAQKTQSYQLNKNLLLSDNAKAKSLPNLEIFADDVKASHGATVGKLDPEHLFYLTSRGITKNQAQAILVHGFCEEVVAKLSTRSLQDKAYQYLMHEVLQ